MPFDPLEQSEFMEGPTPKPGQTVPPTNIPAGMARGRESAVELGAEMTGVADVRRMLSGETPWTEAIAGAIPMLLGGPEASAAERGAERGVEAVGKGLMPELASRYPKVGPPVPKIDPKTGKSFLGKQLTPEAETVQKARLAAQKDIDKGNYTPYFKVSERSDVNPTRYDPYISTTNVLPAKQQTIDKYLQHATNPEGAKRLQDAYQKGLEQPAAANWYFLGQLEKEFIKEYGEQGPAMFKKRVADAMAATTGGADPNANLMMAHYGNYLEARGEAIPEASHQYPFPVGGRYAAGNMEQYQKMLMAGGTGVTAENPKRYNFSASFLGNPNAATIDEQMSKLFDPKISMPVPGTYGAYHQALNDLANANGVDPRYFQEVAWAGSKASKGAYKAKPMIEEYNEAIERTSRITGVPPAEVVRRGIVRAEMPLYGAAGVIGVGAAAQQGNPLDALGAGAE